MYILKDLVLAYRFFLIGLLATITHMFFVWWFITKVLLNVYYANFYAFLVAFFVSFLGHYYWTFKERPKIIFALLKMLVVSISAFFLNIIALTFFIEYFLFLEVNAALAAASIVPLLSFVGMRLWIFKKN
jgi:putative flippase GtrA